ncbi:aminoglycoside phosphotransferase (APT) family kinase protein [Actinoplanes octamycinicus]|uniref:Aminoglycoside phosphotransferase (APT) family kinase protein n=1 Tax=Actinoplanes octamycinicus TaxID=135948 RepID=A0A7W7M819_9ACTN|nr:phosphotransferase [Actinoplanes octamycinicus]MBB4740434.1 aminoglycoside phosphotransferase (APT) family kinase protein [Actinoplanes octamycinicus]GIE59694.1 hypothetical protein Aoc01nite_50960 [Actinoplanes octamycinicus]
MRHGYTNDTRRDGDVVIKRFQGPDAELRRATESRVLTRMAAAGVPVPDLIAEPPGELWTRYVPGAHGQDLIDAGHAAAVLDSCGRTLTRLRTVHGDYGPNNMLFDPVTFATVAVLDWEWAHDGDPIEDLAWCEWIVRMHHPHAAADLDALFTGYGHRPPWPARHAAMLAKCHAMRTVAAATAGPDSPAAHTWRHRIDLTESWRPAR